MRQLQCRPNPQGATCYNPHTIDYRILMNLADMNCLRLSRS